jgi:hypothetical protein
MQKFGVYPEGNGEDLLSHANSYLVQASFSLMSPQVVRFMEIILTFGYFDRLRGLFVVRSTGLDSTAATGVVETLRSLADSGKTVIAVIHQPSQHVFASFDDLLLVSEGKQMFFGDVAGVRQYMNTHVTKAPSEMGTAEHILDCISKTEMLGESGDEAEQRLHKLAELAMAEDVDVGKVDGKKLKKYATGVGGGPKANILVQFKLLLQRALRENFRGKAKLVIQTVQQVSLGLIYGGIYSIGSNQVSSWIVFLSLESCDQQ